MSPLGEVLLATTTQFTAQALQLPRPDEVSPLPDPPPFGALVCIYARSPGPNHPLWVPGEPDSDFSPLLGLGEFDPFADASPAPTLDDAPTQLLGIVFHAETGAIEPGRLVGALGLTEEQLLLEQPQLYELLATRFTAALIGWRDSSGVFRAGLPPRPPRPHAQVFEATESDLSAAGNDLSWLRGIVRGERVPAGLADELTLATLRRLWAAAPDPQDFPLRAGRELSRLLTADYERLKSLIESLAG